MSYFTAATATVTRSEGERTAAGYEEASTTDVLEARGGAQLAGRTLERLQQVHQVGDLIFFSEEDVEDVKAGDAITVDQDSGMTLQGTVETVRPIDDSLLVSL